jgi:hypothetical protein
MVEKIIGRLVKETNSHARMGMGILDEKSLGTIRLCQTDEVLFNVVGEDTTSGLWSNLESLYMMKSLTRKIYLMRRLYSLQMKEGQKFVDHLNTFNTLIV